MTKLKASMKRFFLTLGLFGMVTSVAFAEKFNAPNVKMPNSPNQGKVEPKKADWEELNNTKLANDEEKTIRQLASDSEDVSEEPSEREPSSNKDTTVNKANNVKSKDVDNSRDEKYKFWKFDRLNSKKAD